MFNKAVLKKKRKKINKKEKKEKKKASPKQGTTSDICRLHTKLNHNGINHKETRVDQIARKIWICSLQVGHNDTGVYVTLMFNRYRSKT